MRWDREGSVTVNEGDVNDCTLIPRPHGPYLREDKSQYVYSQSAGAHSYLTPYDCQRS